MAPTSEYEGVASSFRNRNLVFAMSIPKTQMNFNGDSEVVQFHTWSAKNQTVFFLFQKWAWKSSHYIHCTNALKRSLDFGVEVWRRIGTEGSREGFVSILVIMSSNDCHEPYIDQFPQGSFPQMLQIFIIWIVQIPQLVPQPMLVLGAPCNIICFVSTTPLILLVHKKLWTAIDASTLVS